MYVYIVRRNKWDWEPCSGLGLGMWMSVFVYSYCQYFILRLNIVEKVDWWTNLPKQLMSVVPLTSLPSFCLKASSSNSASKKASAPGSLVLHKTHTNTHKRKQRRKKNRI